MLSEPQEDWLEPCYCCFVTFVQAVSANVGFVDASSDQMRFSCLVGVRKLLRFNANLLEESYDVLNTANVLFLVIKERIGIRMSMLEEPSRARTVIPLLCRCVKFFPSMSLTVLLAPHHRTSAIAESTKGDSDERIRENVSESPHRSRYC